VTNLVGKLVHQQLLDPNRGQAGINDLLQGGHRSRQRHFIVAFQLELAILNLGKIVARESRLRQGGCLVELVRQHGFGLLWRGLLEGRARGRPHLLPVGVTER
jgi:hypothetical protein